MSKDGRNILPFFIPHAGCLHQCIFCDQHQIAGTSQLPSDEQIAQTIHNWSFAGLPQVAFYGGSFTALSKEKQAYFLKPAFLALQQNKIFGIRISTRPDYIDDDVINFLKSFGVDTVELGVQSLDDNVLKAAGRGHTAAESFKALALLQKAGFKTGVQIMPGLSEDDERNCLASTWLFLKEKPDMLRIYPTIVLKGTALAKMYYEGTYKPLSLLEAVEICRDLLAIALSLKISVIRIGLQPTKDIAWNSSVVAGPFHPAFGNLVQGALWQKKLKYLLNMYDGSFTLKYIFVAKFCIAPLIGQNGVNLVWLAQNCVGCKIKEWPLPPGDLALGNENGPQIVLSEADFLKQYLACLQEMIL